MTLNLAPAAPAFLAGGGQMGALIRAHDWAATPLGPPQGWPAPLKTMVRLLLGSKHGMFIWWGEARIQIYNDAYRANLPTARRDEMLGKSGPEAWAELWHWLEPDVDRVMNGAEAVWRENRRAMVERDGKLEETWWTYSFSPIEDDTRPSGVGGVLVIATDVTAPQRAASAGQEAMRISEERFRLAQAVGGIGAYEWDPETNAIYASDVARRLWGVAPDVEVTLGMVVHMIHPEDRPQAMAVNSDQLEARAGVAEYRIIRADTGEVRWLSRHAEVVRDEGSGRVRVIGAFQDVTERKLAEEHRELLINELNHRVKNTLATVQSIIRQTLAAAATPGEARERLEERLVAMARAHDTLTRENWSAAAFSDIVAGALQPFGAGRGGPFRLAGPAARLAPPVALALAMALHELATNAVKHGALSVPEGLVTVDWAPADGRIALTWRETGGPRVEPPTRSGFGTRLLSRGLASEFKTTPTADYRPEGLVYQAWMPVAE